MTKPNLTFNIVTFKHPAEDFTFYFTKDETEELCRVYQSLVPDEVIKELGEQEHYYTSFDNPIEGFLPVHHLLVLLGSDRGIGKSHRWQTVW